MTMVDSSSNTPPALSAGCIAHILQGHPVPPAEPYTLQVFGLRQNPNTQTRIMRISDGVHFVYAGTRLRKVMSDNDVIRLHDFLVTKLSVGPFVLVHAFDVVSSGAGGMTGNPIEWGKAVPARSSGERKTTVYVGRHLSRQQEEGKGESIEDDPIEEKKAALHKVEPQPESTITHIKNLEMYSHTWTIKVKLTKKWEPVAFRRKSDSKVGQLMSIEIVDEEGTQILAKLFDESISKYASILEEGKYYLIYNGIVRPGNPQYSSISSSRVLFLDPASVIVPAANDGSIKFTGIVFTSLKDLPQAPHGKVVNALGAVISIGEVETVTLKNGPVVKNRVIKLMDESGQVVSATLWREFAEMELKIGQIIGMRNVRVKEFRGKQLNTTNETAMISDLPSDRVALIQKLYLAPVLSGSLQQSRESNESAGDISSSRKPPPRHEVAFMLIAEIEKLAALDLVPFRDNQYEIRGRVIGVSYEQGFHYMACPICKKKLAGPTCPKCGVQRTAVPVYLFNVQVSDGTGTMWMHVLGDEGEMLVGKPVEALLEVKAAGKEREAFEAVKANVWNVVVRCRKETYQGKEAYKEHLTKVLGKSDWTACNSSLLCKLERFSLFN